MTLDTLLQRLPVLLSSILVALLFAFQLVTRNKVSLNQKPMDDKSDPDYLRPFNLSSYH